jgi:large subunit ribosomal protein L10
VLKSKKFAIVDGLKVKLENALAVVVIDFKGTSVAQMQEIRAYLRAEQGYITVVKNTLLEKAVEGTSYESLKELRGGQIAILWSNEDPGFPAKVAVKFAKEYESIEVRGGVLSGELLDTAGVEVLSMLPSKDELRQQFCALLVAAPQKLLRVFTAGQRDFLGVLSAREKDIDEAA